ncbi:EAL domain-containing protein [Gilvimarinus sp. SDUM040013]|uniref:EAL domain-containing protein n=1 Tax=Gilvimarinus gilvus TaxID=3058038 RepID=A0ABU4RXQ2_9GAMM|nr:EAL domain-containing protein [Gilvimarinus sp. SDUM040013]MDO3386408.1 EAL domain-containing protein [Gilvimarinus sp. SDUM040013]MDX6849674.1 EAL domain-containing protein [Gilvimarinus sp. SDUM040013]
MAKCMRDKLQTVIDSNQLYAVFQPIVNIINGRILGYESLIRGPQGTELATPNQLFAAAASEGQLARLEYACREASCHSFMAQQLPGKLFLNMTPLAFTDSKYRDGVTMAILRKLKLDPERVVFELTEKQPMEEYELLTNACEHFQRQGFAVAIDDLGAGYAGLRIWSELNPDYVKIDRHFISGIDASAVKREFVRFMLDIAQRIGNKVIAEGIETESEFKTLVAMGVEYFQGYYIARPAQEPIVATPAHVLAARKLAMPVSRDMFQHTLREVTVAQDSILPSVTAGEVVNKFRSDVRLTCLPVVSASGEALGMISRSELLNTFSWRYSYELHANKPVSGFISSRSILMDINSDLHSAGRLVTEDPAQNLSVDIIVSEGEAYIGVAKVRNILRSIADEKLRLARHSNPLSALPGNVPLYEWIDQLLCQKVDFVVAYCDINHFKPFNDAFGYSCGDDVIILLGNLLRDVVDQEIDFIGHVGGDDFVVVFRSRDWRERCAHLLTMFSKTIAEQMPEQQLDYWTEDRNGNRRRFGPLEIAIGCVHPDPERCLTHHHVAMLLADAKHRAKSMGGQHVFLSRRRAPETIST